MPMIFSCMKLFVRVRCYEAPADFVLRPKINVTENIQQLSLTHS